jgi:hypothetical protein
MRCSSGLQVLVDCEPAADGANGIPEMESAEVRHMHVTPLITQPRLHNPRIYTLSGCFGLLPCGTKNIFFLMHVNE